jgi:hypothetical protein
MQTSTLVVIGADSSPIAVKTNTNTPLTAAGTSDRRSLLFRIRFSRRRLCRNNRRSFIRVNSKCQTIGISLTQVTPRCSMRANGGLPPRLSGVRSAVRQRGGLPGLPVPVALTGRIPVSRLRPRAGLAGPEGVLRMRALRATDIGDRRHDLSGQPAAFAALVSSHVVGDHAEKRGQCAGPAAGSGAAQL